MNSALASYGSSGFVVDISGDGSVLPLTTRTSSTARHRSSRKRVMDELDRKMLEVDGLPRDHPSASMGPFWFEAPRTAIINCHAVHKGITRKELLQLEALLKRGAITDAFLRDVLIPLNNESSEVPRLRAYNWAVTNYAKGHPLTIVRTNADGTQTFVDPSLSYNQHLIGPCLIPIDVVHSSFLRRTRKRMMHHPLLLPLWLPKNSTTQPWGNFPLCAGASRRA